MYIYQRPDSGARRISTVLGAIAGVGNYSFGAVDDGSTVVTSTGTPVVLETIQSAPLDILDAVTTPTTSIVDAALPPADPPPVLTDAQLNMKKFGYFGSMSVPVGMQVMSIVGGVAGGVAGVIMGLKIANVTRVDTKEILLASALAAASAFAAIFAIRTFE